MLNYLRFAPDDLMARPAKMNFYRGFQTIFFGFLPGLLIFAAVPASGTPVLVVDARTQDVLLAHEAGHPWYPASTTKLMTAFVTFEALADGEVSLKTPVVMTPESVHQESVHTRLTAGQTMTLDDALYATIGASANDVAVALAQTVAGSEEAFVNRMNAAARRLGLNATHFVNANGLFAASQRVSARDLAILALAIYDRFPERRRYFRTTGIIVDGREVDSFNALLTRFPGTLGMKTGFLCYSGRNYVAMAERGGRVMMVVLLGATTDRERAERAAKLLTEAFEGKLPSTGHSLRSLKDRVDVKPVDMRLRVCSDQSASYEAKRDAMFPMGLSGHKSYLQPKTAGSLHRIQTWHTRVVRNVPVPTPRPPR